MRLTQAASHALFSLAGLLVLPLSAAEPFVLVDSLFGRAEFRRSGQLQWQPARLGTKLANNDIFRVLERSSARLKWPLSNVIFVKSNSQVRINVFEDQETKALSQHITVFFGALYFVIEKALPRGLLHEADLKVYTPTAIVCIRGTSFLVQVAPDNGKTMVAVTSGTVLVRNIISNTALFLGPLQKTMVEMNSDPMAPSPLLTDEIAGLRSWVKPGVLDSTVAAGRASTPTAAAKPAPATTDILVVPLADASAYQGAWKPGLRMAQDLAARLRQGATSVATADSTVSDPLEYGRRQSARFVVYGTLSTFEVGQQAKVATDARTYKELAVARVGVRLHLIDVLERKLILDESFVGEASSDDLKSNTWERISASQLDLSDSTFACSVLGRAIRQAEERADAGVKAYLPAR